MNFFNKWCICPLGTLILMCLPLPVSVAADDLRQSASVVFKEMPWGRYTEITIEYLPTAQQAMEATANPWQTGKLTEDMLEAAETDPAVRLIIPGLEYGMTGVFENVRIETDEGISVRRDGRLGARLAPTSTEYTGKVTIFEITLHRLKGSYHADLYNKDMSDREIRARARDFVGRIDSDFDVDMSVAFPGQLATLPEAPESEQLSAQDAVLLRRMQEAGVPPDVQGQTLQMLRNLPPEMVNLVLDTYKQDNPE